MRLLPLLAAALLMTSTAQAAERCRIAWSHYTGWEPAGWLQSSGTAAKWGRKYGVDLSFVLINDYIESVNQYTAGSFDGVTVTNMDALTIPAVGGIDTTVLVIGDFSNGNDGILIKGDAGSGVAALKGRQVKLVEFSVSHYLLARALDQAGLTEKDLRVVNTSDADIGSLIATAEAGDAFVTWNPILMTGRNVAGMRLVFDSAKIPGEIIDTVVVRSNAADGCKKAVTGAWFEAMTVMGGSGKPTQDMIAALAQQAGGTTAEFQAQLRTTRMFYAPAEAAAFAASDKLKETMKFVAKFSFDHGLYGASAQHETFVGIAYPDGSVWGNKDFVRLRFNSSYMSQAAAGGL